MFFAPERSGAKNTIKVCVKWIFLQPFQQSQTYALNCFHNLET